MARPVPQPLAPVTHVPVADADTAAGETPSLAPVVAAMGQLQAAIDTFLGAGGSTAAGCPTGRGAHRARAVAVTATR